MLGKYTALKVSRDQHRGTVVCVSSASESTGSTRCTVGIREPRATLMEHDLFLPLSTPVVRVGRQVGRNKHMDTEQW